MTPGAAALGVDFAPYLARHAQGDWGDELDTFDRQKNDLAVKEGYRILSAYNVPVGNGGTTRIWLITESDRSATTILQPNEY
ncbi:MAG: plasmid related protein [Chloroflexi bacterium]|nr:plasmid related protein [Chloroflexota bacterium]